MFHSGGRSLRRQNYTTIRSDQLQVSVQTLAQEVRELERRNDRMSLASQALWELLRERTDLTEEDLQAKILEVDLRDGVEDGKMSKRVSECPQCQRPTNSKRSHCVYCGAVLEKPNAFE